MKSAVIWISAGERFVEEARHSSVELHDLMPELERILFTPDDVEGRGFDRVAVLPPLIGDYWYLDSVRYCRMAFDLLEEYDVFLWLGSDVNYLAPFPGLFRMAERFDVVAPMGSRRVTGPTVQGLPDCFPEYEIGVTLFRRNAIVRDLLAEWERLHWAHPDVYGNNDMRSFREAVWNTPDLKIERVPPEYSLRWPFGVFMSGEVKIIHGREEIDRTFHPEACSTDDVRRIVNEHQGMRVWSPRSKRWADGVVPGEDEL